MAAVALRHVLPTPQHTPYVPTYDSTPTMTIDTPLYPNKDKITQLNKFIPPYGSRQGWIPRRSEDFGDGGSFPEIHVVQYPVDMGRKATSQNSQIVPLTIDADGMVNYSSIIKQGHRKDVTIFTKPEDMKSKEFTNDDLARPDEATEMEMAERTKKQLEAKLQKKIASKPLAAKATATSKAKYIRYTPANQNPSFNSGANHRIIRMVEMPVDPLEPPKFKHTKVPRGPGSPPVPVMHSPPRKLSKEERDAWRIPPCISNWKNNKGFVIPLDKRLAADGRGLQEPTINDTFAKLSEALYIAERNAREEVAKRNAIKKQVELQKQEEREKELRELAKDARLQRTTIQRVVELEETDEERMERVEREKLREERRREREREHRLEQRAGGNKKSKIVRDSQRDIGEKIALGERVPRSQESLYDQRLFNQSQGIDSGFGDDESYNIYDKRLFGGDRERALYQAPKRDDLEQYGETTTSLDTIISTSRFRPNKDFTGIDRDQNIDRDGPVQFERDRYSVDDDINLKDKDSRAVNRVNTRDLSRVESSSSSSRLSGDKRVGSDLRRGDDDRKNKDEDDRLGLDEFFHTVRTGMKTAEKRQTLGVMHATAGGSGAVDEYRGKRGDRKIAFEPPSEKWVDKEESRNGDRDGRPERRENRGGRGDDHERERDKRRDHSPSDQYDQNRRRDSGRQERERERERVKERRRDRDDPDDYDRKRAKHS